VPKIPIQPHHMTEDQPEEGELQLGTVKGMSATHLVFQVSCAALTLILAVSAVKGGKGGFVIAPEAIFLNWWNFGLKRLCRDTLRREDRVGGESAFL
jgi:hypothetical protein